MSPEQRIEKLSAPAEIRSPRPRECVSNVDHGAVGSAIENAERPGDL
jgi:hypothetical protein